MTSFLIRVLLIELVQTLGRQLHWGKTPTKTTCSFTNKKKLLKEIVGFCFLLKEIADFLLSGTNRFILRIISFNP